MSRTPAWICLVRSFIDLMTLNLTWGEGDLVSRNLAVRIEQLD